MDGGTKLNCISISQVLGGASSFGDAVVATASMFAREFPAAMPDPNVLRRCWVRLDKPGRFGDFIEATMHEVQRLHPELLPTDFTTVSTGDFSSGDRHVPA